MRSKFRFVLLVGIVAFMMCGEVNATSGALKGDSIVMCNGIYYGKHGDGHYHKAVKRGNKWYPDGDSYYSSNPCRITTTKKTTKKTSTTPTKKVTTKKKTTKKETTTHAPKTTASSTTTTELTPTTTTTTTSLTTTAEKMVNAEVTTEKKSVSEDDSEGGEGILGIMGIWLTGALGVAGYNFYKEKRR